MIEKVQAYIVRSSRNQSELCVFWSDYFQVYQLVRGTVEAGESLEAAVIREVEEESGLRNFLIEKKLGETILQVRGEPDRSGSFERQRHHAFLIRIPGSTLDCWAHRSEGSVAERDLVFTFSWLLVDDSLVDRLFEDFKPFVPVLQDALRF